MALLLGLVVAATYGAADFLGGLGSRRLPTETVAFAAQASSLVPLVGLVLLDPGAPSPRDLALGAAAGVAGAVGIALLYRALAVGRMGVVAPVTGVLAAIVPFSWGVSTGERPSGVTLVGVALALGAVALVPGPDTSASRDVDGRVELGLALGAGLGFGIVFTLLGEAAGDAGAWPIVAARLATVTLLGLVAARAGALRVPPAGQRLLVVGAGALDVTANALYLVAVRSGLLSVVAVLSSLYPASTVLLARVVLGERLRRVQLAGLALAGVGVVLIGAG